MLRRLLLRWGEVTTGCYGCDDVSIRVKAETSIKKLVWFVMASADDVSDSKQLTGIKIYLVDVTYALRVEGITSNRQGIDALLVTKYFWVIESPEKYSMHYSHRVVNVWEALPCTKTTVGIIKECVMGGNCGDVSIYNFTWLATIWNDIFLEHGRKATERRTEERRKQQTTSLT